MGNYNFTPTNVVVRPGDSVFWTNTTAMVSHDSTQGTPSNTNGLWTSPSLAFRGTFQFSFTNEGVYPYMCRRHVIDSIPPTGATQTGSVIVTTMNLAPLVRITGPTNSQGFLNRAVVTVTNAVSDLDGTIQQIQLFLGANPVGTVTNPPGTSTLPIGPLFAGTHVLTTRAIDNQGATSTSAPVTIVIRPRTNTITMSGTTFSPSTLPNSTVGDTLVFTNTSGTHTATSDNPVEPLCGGTAILQNTTCRVTLASAGIFPFYCGFHQSLNMTGVVFVAGAPLTSITTPANGAILPEPGNFTVTADATKLGGTITNVEFFANGVLLGRDTTSPFSADAANLPAGDYLLTVRAMDNAGFSGFATPISISVGTALQLVSPLISGNSLQFDLTTSPGMTYVVERTPSLPPVWLPFQTNLANGATLRITDPLPPGGGTQLFYRAFIQP